MPSSRAAATAGTPLGAVLVHVEGPPGVTIFVADAEVPELPPGMAVDGVILISVRTASPVTPKAPLHLRVAAGLDGSADTGEWLESMQFASREGLLQVATRDRDWLAAKGISAGDVHYERQGFSRTLSGAAAGTEFHVTIAWRVDEQAEATDDASTWFAADLALPG